MPLFKHKHGGRTTAGRGTAASTAPDDVQTADYAYAHDGSMGTGRGSSMQPAAVQHAEYRGPAADANGNAYQRHSAGLPRSRYDNDNQVDPYANTIGNNEIAPVEHFSDGRKTATGNSTTGKVERVVGTMLCSQSMKEKGLQKERAAQAFQAQRTELAEAERLEQEAAARRERAVAHGAHPANKALGGAAQAQEFGGNFGQTGATGLGANAGVPSAPMTRGGAL